MTSSKKPPFTLRLEKVSAKISRPQGDRVRTRYTVSTNTDRNCNCYVEGSFLVVGRAISDALRNESPGARSTTAPTPAKKAM